MKYFNILIISFLSIFASKSVFSFEKLTPKNELDGEVNIWLTKGDQSILLQRQPSISFKNGNSNLQIIDIDDHQEFQSIDGFGYTLTGGSAEVINHLSPSKKKELLNDLFGNSSSSINISYLRLSIGASDLNSTIFTYDDIPSDWNNDSDLKLFSLEKDRQLINLLKEILAINPHIKIMATPWTPPKWMKNKESNSQDYKGGTFNVKFFSSYANYFVKYIQEMEKEGITIDAITPQNEPLNIYNNPSLLLPADMEMAFIKDHLGPAFQKYNIKTKIIIYDHNADKPDYPISILNNADVNQYIDGSAFHLYAGDISALSKVRNLFPNKNVYFTEQWTGAKSNFNDALNWHTKNIIIGSLRNWSKITLEWNLANDAQYKPHTLGGCKECMGAITINNSESYTKNVSYYIIAHASKFIPPNSKRIASTQTSTLSTIATKTPEGKTVLIVQNESDKDEAFGIRFNHKIASTVIPKKSVATYVF